MDKTENNIFELHPALHAYCLLKGERFRDYILLEDVREIAKRTDESYPYYYCPN